MSQAPGGFEEPEAPPSRLAEPVYVLVVESVRSGAAPGERLRPPARYNIENRETIIGRSSECTIRLDDMFVSRRHGRLLLRDRELHLEDLESTNQTRVNGAPVPTRVRVHPGDVLLFGGARCRIEAFDTADAGSEPPVATPGAETTGSAGVPPVGTTAPDAAGAAELAGGEADPWHGFKPPRVFVAGPLPGEPRRSRLRVLALLLGAAAVLAVALWLLR